eukprot:TRINITY_DN16391_c0_g1_i4.p1 TRINITY_DN16391_c0_g1~~TRINITY_DN16391_c0_g1_i4.p1  ORF type:complete len:396 (-),score=62.24 TRINITY_DN16391_c0_g1_i4:80-1267(-)
MPEGDRQQGNTAAAAQLPLPRVGAANGDGSRPLLGGVEGASSSSDVGESSRTNAEAPLVRSSSGSASIAPAEAATAVRDARGSTSLESRTARPCALMVQRLDQAILWYCRHQGWVPRTENPPEFAARQLRKLRLPVAACLFLTTAAVLMQLWCFFKGWLLLAFLGDAASAYCSELRHWLFGYCVALTMTPFCFAVVGPLVAWWAANGAVIRSNLPAADRCKANAPELWGFVDEVVYLMLASSLCCLVMSILLLMLRRFMNNVQRLWGSTGPAIEDVIRNLFDGPPVRVPEGTECSICLEPATPRGRSATWRTLPCGHNYHTDCLLEWLRLQHRCPLCRLDLHAYFLDDQGEVTHQVSEASPQQRDRPATATLEAGARSSPRAAGTTGGTTASEAV